MMLWECLTLMAFITMLSGAFLLALNAEKEGYFNKK